MSTRARSVRAGVSAIIATAALGLGLLTSPAAASDSSPGQKPGPLTPALQDLADGTQPSGKGAVRSSAADVLTTTTGRLLVNVRLADTSGQTLDQLRAAGARVRFVDKQLSMATVAIAASDLDSLAAVGSVESAREVLRPMTNAACPSGPFVSEGVTQLKAALARTQFSVTGRDITVGVLSDSYDVLGGAATDVANGELPGVTNPCGDTAAVGNLAEGTSGSIDEGRAMAQIVHDVAPGAKILFASAFLGDLAFAQSIRDLAAQGANIIVDDVTYFNEPMYQDGPIAKAVADVTAQGVVYFSSAANSNMILGGNRVGSYEAPAFRPTACPASIVTHYGPQPVSCHNFSTVGTDNTYNFSIASFAKYSLGWNEPQFGITTDLDLCAVSSPGESFIFCSEAANLTTQDAAEFLSLTGTGSASLVVVRFTPSGTPRFKLISHRSNLTALTYNTSTGGDVVGPTIFGHNASIPGATVAAVPFNNSAVLENFSSWGPARYCWGPVVGTTPAAPLTPCQTATVDMSATDGGQNSFFGGGSPNRFYGTSAAAPHAAALAALMLDKEPCLTPAQVINALRTTGQPVGGAPVDGAGGGLVDGVASLTAASAVNCDNQPPLITSSTPSGWYRTASVSGTVTAKDHRLVTALSCTGGTFAGVTGIGTTDAKGTLTVTGEGSHTIACQGTDAEGNTGFGTGSNTPVTVGIDTGAPAVVCRPAAFQAGQPATVTADVQDAISGPANPTVSVAVSTARAGSFTVPLTGSDVAGNTATTSCAYKVSAVILGAAKAKANSKKTYRAIGLPASAKVVWTLKRGSSKVASRKLRTDSSGVSAVRIRFPGRGRYVVSAKSGGVKASKAVRVR